MIKKILKLIPNSRISLEEKLQPPFFTKHFPNAVNNLIKPGVQGEYKTFIISKDDPNNWQPFIEKPMIRKKKKKKMKKDQPVINQKSKSRGNTPPKNEIIPKEEEKLDNNDEVSSSSNNSDLFDRLLKDKRFINYK